jgi:hypothetical protein
MVEVSSAALGIAVISCIGRSVLSWLPPGEIGSHRTGELPITWAVSYLLGSAAIAVCAVVAALLRVPVSCAWFASAGALLALARWATLPAALVPRHEVPHERTGFPARLLYALTLGAGILACSLAKFDGGSGLFAVRAQAWLSQGWLLGLDGPASSRGALDLPPLDAGAMAFVSWPAAVVSEIAARAHLAACMAAAILLAERAMAIARRPPLGRRLVLALLALALTAAASAEDGDLTLAAVCALALLGMLSWARRADRRGLALACIAWCSLALVRPGGWALALAGLAAMFAATARPSLRRTALWTSASALVLLALWPLAAWLRHVPLRGDEPLASLSSSWALGDRTAVALAIAPIWILLGASIGPALIMLARTARSVEDPDPAREADRPKRDLAALLCFGALLACTAGSLVAMYDGSLVLIARTWAPGLLVQAAPFAAVLAARALLPAERAS